MFEKYVISHTPKREDFLSFNSYWLGEEEKQSILEVLDSGWITTGPKTKLFEKEFAEYSKSKHAIALNSCTAGLHLALVSCDIGVGDEVIVPDMTFTATANVVVHSGATPIIADVRYDNMNIDVSKLEEKITEKTKAIIPVHMAGHPCNMDEIQALAKKYNLTIIEDAAHATEAIYKGKKIGSISPLTAFSFYATKNMTTAEGGMLTTNDDDLADKIRVLSLHGMSKDAWKRYSNEGYKHYDVVVPGFKYNMTDIQASLGLNQLKKISNFLEIRNKHWKLYSDLLSDVDEIELLSEEKDIVHSRHLFIIKLDTSKLTVTRDEFMTMLIKENIGVSVHFKALHTHSYYKDRFNLKDEDFPVATKLSDSVISLPFYPKLKEEDIVYVCNKIKELINKVLK